VLKGGAQHIKLPIISVRESTLSIRFPTQALELLDETTCNPMVFTPSTPCFFSLFGFLSVTALGHSQDAADEMFCFTALLKRKQAKGTWIDLQAEVKNRKII